MTEAQLLDFEDRESLAFASTYLKYISDLILQLNTQPIAEFLKILEKARAEKRHIFFIGNGGSASTATHFANDIGAGTRSWDNPFRTIALTDNIALLTAIANDHGYDKIFSYQLRMLMQPGDVVVGISASGNSPNVVQAFEYAVENSATTVGLTGFDGGELAKLSKVHIHVPTKKGEYGPVEDVHMVVNHLVGAYLSANNPRR